VLQRQQRAGPEHAPAEAERGFGRECARLRTQQPLPVEVFAERQEALELVAQLPQVKTSQPDAPPLQTFGLRGQARFIAQPPVVVVTEQGGHGRQHVAGGHDRVERRARIGCPVRKQGPELRRDRASPQRRRRQHRQSQHHPRHQNRLPHGAHLQRILILDIPAGAAACQRGSPGARNGFSRPSASPDAASSRRMRRSSSPCSPATGFVPATATSFGITVATSQSICGQT